jgi:citrate lyase subunit beta/citryl-CoA lyase
MREDLPVWRSLMFVPVNVEKFVKTGADRGADGIILDLEDAVAPSQKDHARTLIADAIPHVSRNGADVLVRINRPWRMMVRDIEAAVIPGVSALVLTKVDSAEHVLAVAEMVDELEAERNLARRLDEVRGAGGVDEGVLPHGGDRAVPSSHRFPEPGIGRFRR